jgi:hypothetical protein
VGTHPPFSGGLTVSVARRPAPPGQTDRRSDRVRIADKPAALQ